MDGFDFKPAYKAAGHGVKVSHGVSLDTSSTQMITTLEVDGYKVVVEDVNLSCRSI